MTPESPSAWSDLGGGIRVRQSRAFRMNSVLLLHPEAAVAVDPGVLPSELDELAGAVREASPRSVTLVFTHAHWDHVLGRPWWPGAKSVAHDRFAPELHRDRERILGEARAVVAKHGEAWERGFEAFQPDLAVSGLHFMRIDPWRLVLRDAPGHCDSQLSLHLPESRLLVAADMLSDIEIPWLNRACEVYRRTLEDLLPLARGGAIETLVPGHGSIARGRDAVLQRLHRDLDYLERLETAARDALRERLTLEAARSRLEAMEYLGKDSSETPTREIHLQNIDHAYHGLVAAGRSNNPSASPAR